METKRNYKIGTQSYGLGSLFKTDFEGTIRSIRETGFDLVEPLVVPQDKQGKLPANLWTLELLEKAVPVMNECGLEMHSAHIGAGIGPFRTPPQKIAEKLRRIMEITDIRLFVFSGMFGNDRGAESWASYLKTLADLMEGTDARIVYHNHNTEFTPVFSDGSIHYPLDTFFEKAGPEVRLQLDIGWAAYAGDEEAFFGRYKDRIISLHCKDFAQGYCRSGKKMASLPNEAFCAIGAGEVKTGRLVSRYLSLPDISGDIIIDQDKTAGDMSADLKTGFANLSIAAAEPEPVPEKAEVISVTIERSRLSLMTFSFALDMMTKKMSIQDTLQLAADSGVPYVDVLMVKEKEIPDYLAAMSKTGVKVLCKIANIPFLGDEKKCKETMRREMELAKALDAELFMIVPYVLPTEMKKARRLGKDAVRKILIERFSQAVDEGRRNGLTVCFETTPHDEFALSSAEDCRYVLERVPGLGLVFDTANMLPAGEEALPWYEQLKDRIVHVHLKDVALTKEKRSLIDAYTEYTADGAKMNCCLWGEGTVPVGEIYDRMIRDGYSRLFAIEYAHPKGTHPIAVHRKQLEKQLGS